MFSARSTATESSCFPHAVLRKIFKIFHKVLQWRFENCDPPSEVSKNFLRRTSTPKILKKNFLDYLELMCAWEEIQSELGNVYFRTIISANRGSFQGLSHIKVIKYVKNWFSQKWEFSNSCISKTTQPNAIQRPAN